MFDLLIMLNISVSKGMHHAVVGAVWGVLLATWQAREWSVIPASSELRGGNRNEQDTAIESDPLPESTSTSALDWHGFDVIEG